MAVLDVATVQTLPPALHTAQHTILSAWDQHHPHSSSSSLGTNAPPDRKAECQVLLEHSRSLVLEVGRELEKNSTSHHLGKNRSHMARNLRDLERACLAVQTAVRTLASKSFAWRLLYHSKISRTISQAQAAVADASHKFNLGSHLSAEKLQNELMAARTHDLSELTSYLTRLSQNDQSILDALQYADGPYERRTLAELTTAFTKHVQTLHATSSPTESFIHLATVSLNALSHRDASAYIPRWVLTSLEVSFDRNDTGSRMGSGSFGRVWKGDWDGRAVAVKEMHPPDAREAGKGTLEVIRGEIANWTRLVHPNVQPLFGACLEATQPFIVSQYCEKGNVLKYLRANPQVDRVRILYEVCLGMMYLHDNAIIHGNLKASNILMSDSSTALLTDYGLSNFHCQTFNHGLSQALPGTLRWMAPERLLGQRGRRPSDVYSFGLAAWEVFTGMVPYKEIGVKKALIEWVVSEGRRPERPDDLEGMVGMGGCEEVWRLMRECWGAKRTGRPVFGDVAARLKEVMDARDREWSESDAMSFVTASYYPPDEERMTPSPPPVRVDHEEVVTVDSSQKTVEEEIPEIPSSFVSDKPIPYLRNVVVFGERGAGKSSIVNMLAGKDVFEVGGGGGKRNKQKGCVIKFDQQPMNMYEASGEEALQELYDGLSKKGGISVVVFVTRIPTTRSTVEHYRSIRSVFCGDRVAVIGAITGREFEDDNLGWWRGEKETFKKKGMTFVDCAIGTGNGLHGFDGGYTDLRRGLRWAISKHGQRPKKAMDLR